MCHESYQCSYIRHFIKHRSSNKLHLRDHTRLSIYYDSSVFGSAAIIDITFNNGQSTNVNQQYQMGDVTKVSARTVNGTFTITTDSINPNSIQYSPIPWLTTDQSGRGIFAFNEAGYIPSFIDESIATSANTTNRIILGNNDRGNIGLEYSTILLNQNYVYDAYFRGLYDYTNNTLVPWYLDATLVASDTGTNTVPEPTSLLLLSSGGLLGFVFLHRKKNQA